VRADLDEARRRESTRPCARGRRASSRPGAGPGSPERSTVSRLSFRRRCASPSAPACSDSAPRGGTRESRRRRCCPGGRRPASVIRGRRTSRSAAHILTTVSRRWPGERPSRGTARQHRAGRTRTSGKSFTASDDARWASRNRGGRQGPQQDELCRPLIKVHIVASLEASLLDCDQDPFVRWGFGRWSPGTCKASTSKRPGSKPSTRRVTADFH
jgi:hypothetical protein